MIIVPVKNPASLEQALKQYKLKIYKYKKIIHIKINKWHILVMSLTQKSMKFVASL